MSGPRWSLSEPTSFAVRMAGFYGALFVVAGTKLPYFPLWLDARGLSTSEIAVVVATPLFVRILFTPMIGVAADAGGDRRRTLILLAWAAFAALLALGLVDGFWPILTVTVVLSVATTSLMPLAETIAMAGVRRHSLDYGRMRLWGSLSFIGASFVAGLAVGWWGRDVVLALLVAGGAATAFAAYILPKSDSGGPPVSAMREGKAASRRGTGLAEAARLALSPPFALFIAAVAASQASHAVFYTFGVLHWQAQGLGATWAGVLWAVGVAAEIGLFAFSRRIVAAIGARRLLLVGALAGVVRWTLMALDPSLMLLIPLQALHGLTYGASHLAAVHWMSESVRAEQAGTAQSIYSSVTHGIAMGLATIGAGWLYAGLGGGAYWTMAALAGVGSIAAIALMRRGPAHSDRPS
jgi:PPP family 3-phenylpropionic acid transporter